MKKIVLVLGLLCGKAVVCASATYTHGKPVVLTDQEVEDIFIDSKKYVFKSTVLGAESSSFWVGFFTNFGSGNSIKEKSMSNLVVLSALACFIIRDLEDVKVKMKQEHTVYAYVKGLKDDKGVTTRESGEAIVKGKYPQRMYEDTFGSPLSYSVSNMGNYLTGSVVGYVSRAALSTTYTAACAWWKLRQAA